MLGRFKRRVHAPLTPVKPTVRKFLQVFDRTVKEVDRLKAPEQHHILEIRGTKWLVSLSLPLADADDFSGYRRICVCVRLAERLAASQRYHRERQQTVRTPSLRLQS
jgi:hypothetical protein